LDTKQDPRKTKKNMLSQILVLFTFFSTYSSRIYQPPAIQPQFAPEDAWEPSVARQHEQVGNMDVDQNYRASPSNANDPEYITVSKMIKKGAKFLRRYIRQALSDMPENGNGAVEVFQDIFN
jgi:hypothetical protein